MNYDMLTAAQLAKLLIITAQLSGYPAPPEGVAPRVHEINTAQMRKLGCPTLQPRFDCPLGGLTIGDDIYVDTEWLTVGRNAGPDGYHYTEASYVVHEMVHWYQYRDDKVYTCPTSFFMEIEAYNVQNKYERQYEPTGDHRARHRPPSMCGGVVIWVATP